MKNLMLWISLIFSTTVFSYTDWTVKTPHTACVKNGKIKLVTMVNTGAGFMEFHQLKQDAYACYVEEGEQILEMNIYHKSKNDMEAGFNIVRSLRIPQKFKNCRVDKLNKIKINYTPDENIVRNGKVGRPDTLIIRPKCPQQLP